MHVYYIYTMEGINEAPPNLDSILHRLHGKVKDSQWYCLGLAMGSGVPEKFLEQLKDCYPENQSLIEVLDYWLRNHPGQPTWQEINDAQEKVKSTSKVDATTSF